MSNAIPLGINYGRTSSASPHLQFSCLGHLFTPFRSRFVHCITKALMPLSRLELAQSSNISHSENSAHAHITTQLSDSNITSDPSIGTRKTQSPSIPAGTGTRFCWAAWRPYFDHFTRKSASLEGPKPQIHPDGAGGPSPVIGGPALHAL